MSVRTLAAALASGLLLAPVLWSGEASAQTSVCRGGATPTNMRIICEEVGASASDITINTGTINAVSTGMNQPGIHAHIQALGTGNIDVDMTGGTINTSGQQSIGVDANHAGASGNVDVDVTGGSITASGAASSGVHGQSSGTGSLTVNMAAGTVSATGPSSQYGVRGAHAGTGNVSVTMSGGTVSSRSYALGATHTGTAGNVSVSMTGGSVRALGASAAGISAGKTTGAGSITIAVSEASSAAPTVVKAEGVQGNSVHASRRGAGSLSITVSGGLIEASGAGGSGVYARSSFSGTGDADSTIRISGGTIRATGTVRDFFGFLIPPYGVYNGRTAGTGDADIDMTGGRVETAAELADGLHIYKAGTSGDADIDMTGGAVTTKGREAHGIHILIDGAANTSAGSIDVGGVVTVEGAEARGILGNHGGSAGIAAKTTASARIAAPFAVGMEARATNDASAAGRLVVTHGGAVEARDAGVVAWAARSSGHTMGDGAQTADDAARTAPMIHVTSSGTVTVGASVMDAFTQSRIAGADETLSAAERAVLDAVTAGDSDALDTALGALPSTYDDDWKAEARSLLAKRAAPTGDAALAHRAAEEILGLSRAGIRAVAMSHTGIADHIRGDDALSDAERTVLEAVLKGSGLEAALAALPAAYTDAWKDGVRQRAASYNAGDVRVEVSGGTVAAEGNGVEALYAVLHDRNGAIAVVIAAGATVSGGRAGVYVANAGLDAGGDGEADDVRRQAVTVDGTVTGGTDAAVHLVGGGRLTVGKDARVLAGSSGVAILVNDPGRSEVVIDGLVRGAAGGEAAVRLSGGGTVTIGLNGRVEANGAANAILADLGTTAATLRAEVEKSAMPWRDEAAAAAARVDGRIVGVGDSMVFLLVDGEGRTGMSRTVPLVEGRPDLSGFPERPPGEGPDRMLCGDASDGRCRLYEALPSVLLSMNGLASYRERMSSARSANGGWARFEAASGKWKARRSTQADVAYNRSRAGLRAGVDVAVGEEGRLGLSAHGVTGSAKMTGNGGKVAVTGVGLGLNATAQVPDGFHIDGQLAVTRYKAGLTSRTGTKLTKLTDGVKGTGYALALEAGRSVAMGGDVTVTPRAGLVWSQVSLRGFTDTRGTAVAMKNAGSFTGRVGVDVEASPVAGGPRLFGSLDVVREFSKTTETRLPGTVLEAAAEPTSVRLGLGFARAWEDGGHALQGSAGYETAGGGNGEFGGALSFTTRF